MEKIDLALMTGIDFPLENCGNLIIHQPSLLEISYLGEQEFFTSIQTLCIDKSVISQEIPEGIVINNFQIFQQVLEQNQLAEQKKTIYEVLKMIFENYRIFITPRSISFSKDDYSFLIDESNFEIFQNYLKKTFCISKSQGEDFNPSGETAKKIADKLMRARKRVAAQKAAENGSGSMIGQYISILSIALRLPPREIVQLTIYQLYDLIERYSLYTNWDIDLRSRLAGANADKPMDNWMKQIH